jgi:hypothetical protein
VTTRQRKKSSTDSESTTSSKVVGKKQAQSDSDAPLLYRILEFLSSILRGLNFFEICLNEKSLTELFLKQ